MKKELDDRKADYVKWYQNMQLEVKKKKKLLFPRVTTLMCEVC